MSVERKIQSTVFCLAASLLILKAVRDMRATIHVERDKRKKMLDAVGLDVAAIHNATDVINAQIERGEIRDMDTLRRRVLDEVAFQKIAIREDH